MSDLKLFRAQGNTLLELDASSAPLEKGLQILFEKNLEVLLGVRFLASEYVTTNGGASIHWVSMRTGVQSSSSTSAIVPRMSSTRACSIWTGWWTIAATLSCWF